MGLGFRCLSRESDGAEEVCLRWNGLRDFLVYVGWKRGGAWNG